MRENPKFDFVVSGNAILDAETVEGLVKIADYRKEHPDHDLIHNVHSAMVMSGLLKRSTFVDLRILDNKTMDDLIVMAKYGNNDGTMLNHAIVGHRPAAFKHDTVTMCIIHLCRTAERFDSAVEAVYDAGVDLSNSVDKRPGYDVVVLAVSEDDFMSMYNAYYKDRNNIELLYDLAVTGIKNLIPLYAVSTICEQLDEHVLKYNKYAVGLLVSAITALLSMRFDIGCVLEEGDCMEENAMYSSELRKCLELLARSAVIDNDNWFGSGDFEAYLGAICGIGSASMCTPCMHANIEVIEDKKISNTLCAYYESINELIELIIKVVITYFFDTSAVCSEKYYINNKLPKNVVTDIVMKLKEIKAKHARILRYKEQLKMDADCSEPSTGLEGLGFDDLSSCIQATLSDLDDGDKIAEELDLLVQASFSRDLDEAIADLVDTGKINKLLSLKSPDFTEIVEMVRFAKSMLCDNSNLGSTRWMLACKGFIRSYDN